MKITLIRKLFILSVMAVYVAACRTDVGTLKIVPVDINQNTAVNLSDIADEIKQINLEFTGESLIARIAKVIYNDGMLIILDGQQNKILVFDGQGKFLRQIGSRGQGPGEYEYIQDIAFDSAEKTVYIAAHNKILFYSTEGVFAGECKLPYSSEYIYVRNGYLNVFLINYGEKADDKYVNRTYLYRIDKTCNLADSLIIKSVYLDRLSGSVAPYKDYVSLVGSKTFVYYPVLTPEPVVRDTLYQLKNNALMPFLKLRFSNEGEVTANNYRTIHLISMWRSERFLFADYQQNKKGNLYFVHDMKTGNSFNMKDGFTDDIHQIEDKVKIHPLALDTEYFYYWHTHINDDDIEEPNPTLYIAKLKK